MSACAINSSSVKDPVLYNFNKLTGIKNPTNSAFVERELELAKSLLPYKHAIPKYFISLSFAKAFAKAGNAGKIYVVTTLVAR